MIKAVGLTKRFGKNIAVDELSFTIATGKVTGFLGPNGAGKSTTMRLMLGLDTGKGTTTYDDKSLSSFESPANIVGVLLEAKAFHPTRSAKNHLRVLAAAARIPNSRVDEVLKIVGLSEVARKAPGKFSLGMAQRLGIAAAILGEPKYLILDEPANGLDPEGIAWLRDFLKSYAKAGNGVLISSHLLSEMSQLADNVIVIGKGKLITETSIKRLLEKNSSSVFVRVNNIVELSKALDKNNYKYSKKGKGLLINDAKTDEIGLLAHDAKLTVLELFQHSASLEDVFLELTDGAAEYSAGGKR
jgi:ABC-2 type transport system ATP-binding protein